MAAKSEAAVVTTITTMTSLNKTCDLFTGDLVTFDEFDRKTGTRTFKVLAHVPNQSCESGTLVCVQATSNLKEKYTVDRHWLMLQDRASEVPFDDDIPS